MSENAKELCRQGNLAASQGDAAHAVSLWQQALKLDPTLLDAWQNQIAILRQGSNLRQALKVADAAIQHLPDKADLYYNRANVYSSLSNYRQAIEDYSSAIRLAPNHAQAYANRGLMHLHEKAFQQAESDFNQALSLNPNDSVAYYHRSTIRMNQDDFEGALKDITQVIKNDPATARVVLAYTQRSSIWARQGNLDQAILDVQSALRTDNSPIPKTELEDLLARYQTLQQERMMSHPHPPKGVQILSHPSKEADYTNGTQTNGMNTNGMNTNSQQKATTGTYITAEGCIRNAKEHLEKQAFAEGLAAINKALQLDPQSAVAYGVRGAIYAMMHKMSDAKQDLDRALEINPQQVDVLANRALWFVLNQQPTEAIVDLQSAYTINPSLPGLHDAWGSCYEKQQLLPQAFAAHHFATVLDANNAQAHNNVGRLYLANGLADKAYPYIARTLELQPNNVRAWMNAGSICLAKNEIEEGLDFLERAVQSGYELAKPVLEEARRRAANPSIPGPVPTADELKQQQLLDFSYELAKFAYRHSGPDRWQQSVNKKGWFGFGERTVVETTQRWGVSIEEMMTIGHNGYAGKQSIASLSLIQEPIVEIRVMPTAGGRARLSIISEAWVRGVNASQKNIDRGVKNNIEIAPDELPKHLQEFLDRTILTIQDSKLYYTGKTIR